MSKYKEYIKEILEYIKKFFIRSHPLIDYNKIYDNIEIKTERFPVPTISEYELIPIKSDNSFKYSATVKFNTTNSLNVSNSPRPPKISEVYGLPNAVDENIRKNL